MRTPHGFHTKRRRDQPVEGTERGWQRGRILPQAQSALARLLRVGYVKRRANKASADRYVITDLGAAALGGAIA